MTGRQPDLDDFSGEPRSFDLRDYALVIRRRAVLIVVMAVLGAVAAAGYAVLSGHKYAATAQVLVTSATQGSSSSSTAQQLATQANMSTEEAIAQSPPVVLQAAKLLHVSPSTLQAEAAKHLTVNVPATTLATSNLLQITWQAKKSAAAQAGANAFANALSLLPAPTARQPGQQPDREPEPTACLGTAANHEDPYPARPDAHEVAAAPEPGAEAQAAAE